MYRKANIEIFGIEPLSDDDPSKKSSVGLGYQKKNQ